MAPRYLRNLEQSQFSFLHEKSTIDEGIRVKCKIIFAPSGCPAGATEQGKGRRGVARQRARRELALPRREIGQGRYPQLWWVNGGVVPAHVIRRFTDFYIPPVKLRETSAGVGTDRRGRVLRCGRGGYTGVGPDVRGRIGAGLQASRYFDKYFELEN